MDEHIADGQIHALSDEFCYILRFYPESPLVYKNLQDIADFQLESTTKYARYLMKFDQATVLGILINNLLPSKEGKTGANHQFILRNPDYESMGPQNASIALKFKRSPLDNLTEKENEPQI